MRALGLLLLGVAAIPAAAAEDPERGEILYEENCAACHGASLEGQAGWRTPGADGILPAPPHDETGHTWHHGDGMLTTYILEGAGAVLPVGSGFVSGMPAFEGVLTPADVSDILGYIKSTWPDQIRAVQAARTEAEIMKEQ